MIVWRIMQTTIMIIDAIFSQGAVNLSQYSMIYKMSSTSSPRNIWDPANPRLY